MPAVGRLWPSAYNDDVYDESDDENDDDGADFLQDPLAPYHDDSVDENDNVENDDVKDESDVENDDDGADFLQDPLSPPASIHPASPLRLKRAAKTSLGKKRA